jgi:HlyD family secretion protein
MVKVDSTVSTLSAAGALAVAISVMLNWAAPAIGQQATSLASSSAQAADAASPRPQWAASATGRVEPKDGEVRITPQVPGKIVEVAVKTNDRVAAGDFLVQLDDDELLAKLAAAESEVQVRTREREEEQVKGPALERRQAEDAASASERALFRARLAFDNAERAARSGTASADAVKAARDRLTTAEEKLGSDKATLDRLDTRTDMPLPTRLESALTQARADLSQVLTAIERTRIRAPGDGTVLSVWAKLGETATPSPDTPLVIFGDLSTLKVRAEVEERDTPKVRLGQRAVVRDDAYPDRDFEGVVTSIAPALGTPRIAQRGPRRPNDVEVLEVVITLDGQPPLLTGMRVDVFFKSESTASAAAVPDASAAAGTPETTSSITRDSGRDGR